MIIPDVNVLVFAHDAESARHLSARKWLEETIEAREPVGLPWVVILGFIRVVTHRGILDNPAALSEVSERVEEWLRHPNIHVITPGEGHAATMFELLSDVGVAGNLTTDAHIAALAKEYKAEVASTDTDFGRFPGVKWVNPLRAAPRKRGKT
jgi:toxin-antitoxin system PIN domain toxin